MSTVVYLVFSVNIVEFICNLTVVKLHVGVVRLPTYSIQLPPTASLTCLFSSVCGWMVAKDLTHVVFSCFGF